MIRLVGRHKDQLRTCAQRGAARVEEDDSDLQEVKVCEEEVLADCIRRNWANVKRIWTRSHNRPIQTRANDRTGVFQSALDEWE